MVAMAGVQVAVVRFFFTGSRKGELTLWVWVSLGFANAWQGTCRGDTDGDVVIQDKFVLRDFSTWVPMDHDIHVPAPRGILHLEYRVPYPRRTSTFFHLQ